MKNKGLLITLAVIGIIVIIGMTLFAGFFWGRGGFGRGSYRGWNSSNNSRWSSTGMMGGGKMGWLDNNTNCWSNRGRFSRIHNWFMGRGWFRKGSNIIGVNSSSAGVLSIEEAEAAVEAYITDYDSKDALSISEIMIFDNHAYVVVKEVDTGIGAFEVLVDPETLAVVPEMGPNMMWNLKYGHMHGGMMSRGYASGAEEMPISDEEALEIANEYLGRNNSDLGASGHPDRFYGYYTIHTERDGKIIGMLSVNGYDGEVLLHTWHGEFIEMTEHAEESHQD